MLRAEYYIGFEDVLTLQRPQIQNKTKCAARDSKVFAGLSKLVHDIEDWDVPARQTVQLKNGDNSARTFCLRKAVLRQLLSQMTQCWDVPLNQTHKQFKVMRRIHYRLRSWRLKSKFCYLRQDFQLRLWIFSIQNATDSPNSETDSTTNKYRW